MLAVLAHHAAALIAAIGAIHFLAFLLAARLRRRETARLESFLATLHTRLDSRSDRDITKTDLDRIDDYLADLGRILDDPAHRAEIAEIRRHLMAKTESLNLKAIGRLEGLRTPLRAFVEAYPFLGIIGTLLAMSLALPAEGPGAGGIADPAAAGAIFQAFADAIWSTVWGLVLGIVLMVVNALVEPGIDRLGEDERLTRELVLAIKSQLGGAPAAPGEGAP